LITFLLGLTILIAGGAAYGRFCEKLMSPQDTPTPAVRLQNGIDFVPLNKWKTALIELLNIAGTGPVLGPVQGILFGPVAFLTIPVGCVLGGALHDYMSGMISIRNDGEQMPGLMRRFLGRYVYMIYHIFVCLLMLLVGAVFIYTPGDLFVSQILHGDVKALGDDTLLTYGTIFVYFAIASLLPIDKVIGRVYPIFGAILLLSAVGIFGGLFVHGYHLQEVWEIGIANVHPMGEHFIPMFFVTVACGIVSGFHSTQATMIARAVSSEKDGRNTFYNMMIVEGFIAMTWAAAAMGAVQGGLATNEELYKSAVLVVGMIAKNMLGDVGGSVAIIGIIVLAITSGDTALRSLRIMLADALKVRQTDHHKAMMIGLPILAIVAVVLYFAKTDAHGFSLLWRYFSWANETIAVFAFAMISVYMLKNGLPYLMALIPGTFYMYVVCAYIFHAPIGFQMSWELSYGLAGAASIAYAVGIMRCGKKQ